MSSANVELASGVAEHVEVFNALLESCSDWEAIVELSLVCLKSGGVFYFAGNGGSAADSQHLAAELIGRFKAERQALPAVALTVDTSIITSVANDYSYDEIFSRQIDGLCRNGDIVFLISTSGNSENLCNAALVAKKKGAHTIGLLGKSGGKLRGLCDLSITVPSTDTARIQECHIFLGHMLCESLEANLVKS